MENILSEGDINRLFSLTSPQLGSYPPINLDALPTSANFSNGLANSAYLSLLQKFRRWNKVERLPNSPTGYKSKAQIETVLKCIYQELLLVMRDSYKQRGAQVITLNQLMREHGGDFRIPQSGKPKKHIQEDVESNAEQKTPFFVRSKITNLKLQQKKISFAQIESHSKLESPLGSKDSRKLRIYGESQLSDNVKRDEQGQTLFRNWLMKQRSRQFEIEKIIRWNRSKCKDAYGKIVMSDYLDNRPLIRPLTKSKPPLFGTEHLQADF